MDHAEQTYAGVLHNKLLRKERFKKVDAFEMFTDYWSIGRGLHVMPKHNSYVPVAHTIMPRPNLRDYTKDD